VLNFYIVCFLLGNYPASEFYIEAYKIQTQGNYPEENIQHTEQGESLKSINYYIFNIFARKMYNIKNIFKYIMFLELKEKKF